MQYTFRVGERLAFDYNGKRRDATIRDIDYCGNEQTGIICDTVDGIRHFKIDQMERENPGVVASVIADKPMKSDPDDIFAE